MWGSLSLCITISYVRRPRKLKLVIQIVPIHWANTTNSQRRAGTGNKGWTAILRFWIICKSGVIQHVTSGKGMEVSFLKPPSSQIKDEDAVKYWGCDLLLQQCIKLPSRRTVCERGWGGSKCPDWRMEGAIKYKFLSFNSFEIVLEEKTGEIIRSII